MSSNDRIYELIDELKNAHEPLQARIKQLEEAIRTHRDAPQHERVLSDIKLHAMLDDEAKPMDEKLPHWSDYLIECTRHYLTLKGEIKPIAAMAAPVYPINVTMAGPQNPIQQSREDFLKQQLERMPPHLRAKAEASRSGRCTECGHKEHKGRLCENFQAPAGQQRCECNDIPIRGWGTPTRPQ